MEPLRKIESASFIPKDIWMIGFVSFLVGRGISFTPNLKLVS